jgi:hypothetical protein
MYSAFKNLGVTVRTSQLKGGEKPTDLLITVKKPSAVVVDSSMAEEKNVLLAELAAIGRRDEKLTPIDAKKKAAVRFINEQLIHFKTSLESKGGNYQEIFNLADKQRRDLAELQAALSSFFVDEKGQSDVQNSKNAANLAFLFAQRDYFSGNATGKYINKSDKKEPWTVY